MENEEKQFGDRFKAWYQETQENEIPDYSDRTPESELTYKLLWTFIILLIFFSILGYITCNS
jgi:hypothetical protein